MRIGRIVRPLNLVILRMCHRVLSAYAFHRFIRNLPAKPGVFPLLPLSGAPKNDPLQKSSNVEANIAILTAQASSGIYIRAPASERTGHWRITAGEFQIMRHAARRTRLLLIARARPLCRCPQPVGATLRVPDKPAMAFYLGQCPIGISGNIGCHQQAGIGEPICETGCRDFPD